MDHYLKILHRRGDDYSMPSFIVQGKTVTLATQLNESIVIIKTLGRSEFGNDIVLLYYSLYI